jgi:hypothetical protein
METVEKPIPYNTLVKVTVPFMPEGEDRFLGRVIGCSLFLDHYFVTVENVPQPTEWANFDVKEFNKNRHGEPYPTFMVQRHWVSEYKDEVQLNKNSSEPGEDTVEDFTYQVLKEMKFQMENLATKKCLEIQNLMLNLEKM